MSGSAPPQSTAVNWFHYNAASQSRTCKMRRARGGGRQTWTSRVFHVALQRGILTASMLAVLTVGAFVWVRVTHPI